MEQLYLGLSKIEIRWHPRYRSRLFLVGIIGREKMPCEVTTLAVLIKIGLVMEVMSRVLRGAVRNVITQ